MEEKKDTFTYTYSAKEQDEIRSIRSKYAPPSKSETPLEHLRRVDAGATRGASITSMIIGIVSALLLGVGMCCTMVWGNKLFIVGVLIGVVGIAGVIAAYPIYTRMVKRKREKLAPEIMRLSDELMK